MEVRVRMIIRPTDRSALLEWVPVLIVNDYSKFEVNIFSNDRYFRKRLILSEILSRKRSITMSKMKVTCPTGMGPLLIVNN